MKVRLTKRWGGRVPGTTVSVSDARAKYLQDVIKIGKIVGQVKEEVKETIIEASKKIDEEKAVEEAKEDVIDVNVSKKKGK